MIHPNFLFNTKTPDHPSRMTLMSPSASSDSEREKPKVDSEPTPIVVEGIGDTVVSENVNVRRLLSTEDGPIKELSFDENTNDMPKATWQKPYGKQNDTRNGYKD